MMKRAYRNLVGVVILTPLLVVFVNAQEKVLSEEEYKSIESKAQKLSWSGFARSTMRSFHFDGVSSTEPTMEISEVTESAPDEKRRSLRTTKEKGTTREREEISIGKDKYFRTEDTAWVKSDARDPNRFTVRGTVGTAQEPRTEFKFRSLGKSKLDSTSVDVYEASRFREYRRENGALLTAYTVVEKLWIGTDGRLVKRTSQTIQSDGRKTIDITWTYEYPASIKIEAPIK